MMDDVVLPDVRPRAARCVLDLEDLVPAARLFELCMYAGARVATADPAVLGALERYGTSLGLAFQAVDDILDITSESGAMGKTTGKDQAQGKATVVKSLGLDKARAWAGAMTEQAVAVRGVFQTASPYTVFGPFDDWASVRAQVVAATDEAALAAWRGAARPIAAEDVYPPGTPWSIPKATRVGCSSRSTTTTRCN